MLKANLHLDWTFTHSIQKDSPVLLGYALVENFEKHFPRESNTHFSSCNRIYRFSSFLLPLFTLYSIKLNLDVSTLSLAIITNLEGELLGRTMLKECGIKMVRSNQEIRGRK